MKMLVSNSKYLINSTTNIYHPNSQEKL